MSKEEVGWIKQRSKSNVVLALVVLGVIPSPTLSYEQVYKRRYESTWYISSYSRMQIESMTAFYDAWDVVPFSVAPWDATRPKMNGRTGI